MLSYNELVDLVNAGAITGVQEGAINGSSIDIHLGPKIIGEAFPQNGVINLLNREPFGSHEAIMTEEQNTIFIAPGAFFLAQSIEMFNLPDDISAEVCLKSSIARSGLEHLNAGHCDPLWHGSNLTMEFKNMLQWHGIILTLGMPIIQMKFFRHAQAVPVDKSYAVRGRYNKDEGPSGVK